MKKSSTKKTSTAKRAKRPSEASLREIPPLKEDGIIEFGRGPEGLKRALAWSKSKRGRPKKGVDAEGTVVKTVRLPRSVYEELARLAGEQEISEHVALRKAVTSWIAKARKAS